MTTFDFSPLYRSTIGFDHLVSLLDSVASNEQVQNTYPPYNIELIDQDKYRISMAVAGFVESEITIETALNSLTISAKKEEKTEQKKYLYRGIAARDFQRHFKLENHVRVDAATLENGLLHIDLVREVPEAMKPRQIPIAVRADSGKLLESE
ncbi:MAG: Hsp20 family protein [Pseudomonadales bacterium]|nr:Hsp20 family protein [Pseudomonadales bacterium]